MEGCFIQLREAIASLAQRHHERCQLNATFEKASVVLEAGKTLLRIEYDRADEAAPKLDLCASAHA